MNLKKTIVRRQAQCLALYDILLAVYATPVFPTATSKGYSMYLTKLASIQLVLWKMLEEHNEDPTPVFKQVQLDPALMHKPGERYSLIKIAELWKEMEKRIKDPCFGLTAATCWHPSNFGSMGYALLTSQSLRVTFERLIRFHRVISDVKFGELQEDKNNGYLLNG